MSAERICYSDTASSDLPPVLPCFHCIVAEPRAVRLEDKNHYSRVAAVAISSFFFLFFVFVVVFISITTLFSESSVLS